MDKFDPANDFYFEDLGMSRLNWQNPKVQEDFLAKLRELGVPIAKKDRYGEESSS